VFLIQRTANLVPDLILQAIASKDAPQYSTRGFSASKCTFFNSDSCNSFLIPSNAYIYNSSHIIAESLVCPFSAYPTTSLSSWIRKDGIKCLINWIIPSKLRIPEADFGREDLTFKEPHSSLSKSCTFVWTKSVLPSLPIRTLCFNAFT